MHSRPITVDGTQHRVAGVARAMAVATVGGGLSGLLVGGLGGRLAMRLLAVTSPSAAHGGITDDDAIVGVVSFTGSVALALFTLQAGALGGLVLLLARRVLPGSPGARAAGSALLTGTLGGAAFVPGYASVRPCSPRSPQVWGGRPARASRPART